MKRTPGILKAALLAVAAALAPATAEAISLDAKALEEAFVKAVKRVRPAVVHVRAEGRAGRRVGHPLEGLFGAPRQPERRSQGGGSGVIVSEDGLILTNHHVAGNADRITVKLADGRELPATRVGTDQKTDICVLRIAAAGLPFAPLGDSDELAVGRWALAIGNPFGLDLTVTLGIISARGRRNIVRGGGYEDFIQTDAAINPGNSGGPLVNIDGEIIGINTAIFSRSGGYMGVGFAVPANLAKIVMDRLVEFGKVTRSWLGVGIQDVDADVAKQLGLGKPAGVVVTRVYEGSPASRAKFERYDVIVNLDGREVENAGDLRNRIAHTPSGSEVAIGILRDGRSRTLEATLAPHPSEATALSERREEAPDEPESDGKIGVRLTEVSDHVARELGLDEAAGLLIVHVRPGSPAHVAGLRRGNVILQADRRRVDTLRDFARVRERTGAGETLLLLVWDGRDTKLVGVRVR